ncbi:hypothetical protein TVAG_281100 [Trichomonas vaginalis G3]|uniref:Putative nitroreductase TM1586 domain-containing protein n=1 Tax=Trichomonas vaginalis (strain ATCC PRA-98 / G3) TaxID=412133 RepID=A2DRN0_TRIV3|nr:NADH Oxidase domain-containing protein [Trichomonas vaginalis G3]EAY16993.1 hypothetical protein TVAG_281100 [Trichomonas vaginalis G3]KAI5508954.1 NADH Oxidase domain-containing protein [Trichomonas vaginalis G3]|eukprot:XP_001329216.1 hypothetical protein [Trichomonas vaginalis G3]
MSVEYIRSMPEAFKRRHSTRAFTKTEFDESKMKFVENIVEKINNIGKNLGYKIELVVEPAGFGRLNMLVNEAGWVLARASKEKLDVEQTREQYKEIGYMFERCILEFTRMDIATCWFGGFNRSKAIEYFENKYDVIIVFAFGNEGEDRWVESVVKWFGSFRGESVYEEEFFDRYEFPMKIDNVGEREDICLGLHKIPCVMKPHNFRILFQEPNIHVFINGHGVAMFPNNGWFDIGIVLGTLAEYYESEGYKTEMVKLENAPTCPKTGEYVCTVVLNK